MDASWTLPIQLDARLRWPRRMESCDANSRVKDSLSFGPVPCLAAEGSSPPRSARRSRGCGLTGRGSQSWRAGSVCRIRRPGRSRNRQNSSAFGTTKICARCSLLNKFAGGASHIARIDCVAFCRPVPSGQPARLLLRARGNARPLWAARSPIGGRFESKARRKRHVSVPLFSSVGSAN